MLISQRPTLSEEILTDNRSQFVIEPLEPGFGYTLGNSLRRTLLSSIPGWLQVVGERQRILIHQLPERAQIDVPLTEQLIVEYYSK